MSEFGDFREAYVYEPDTQRAAGEVFERVVQTQLDQHLGSVAVSGEDVFSAKTLRLEGNSPWGELSYTVVSNVRGPRVSVAKGEDDEPVCDYTKSREGHVLRNDRSVEGEGMAIAEIIKDPASASEIAADFIAARRMGAKLGFNSQPVGTDEMRTLEQLLGDAGPTA